MAFPSKSEEFRDNEVSDAAMDDLQSTVISSYEQAVRRGIEPIRALAAIIQWAAGETARVQAGPRAPRV